MKTLAEPLKKILVGIHFKIINGEQLHTALQTSPLFPPLMIQLVKIGEESGHLEQMLLKIVEFYEAEIEHFFQCLSQLLEPLIMVVLGVLVGGLVIAMYLPIFKMGSVV